MAKTLFIDGQPVGNLPESDKITVVATISKTTYTTYGAQLAAILPYFQALTDAQKMKSKILSIGLVFNFNSVGGIYTNLNHNSTTSLDIREFNLATQKLLQTTLVPASTVSISDFSSAEAATDMQLVIVD